MQAGRGAKGTRTAVSFRIFFAAVAAMLLVVTLWGEARKMNLEQNKAIARDYLAEIVNNGNMAAFDRYFSEEVLFNNSSGFKQQITAGMQAIRSAFPDHQLTIRDQVAEGDKVVTRVTFQGTHQGRFNGIEPTGRHVEWLGIAIDRIANGKVVEMWHVQNSAALMQQIGAKAPAATGR